MARLEARNALVTGASSGIGAATAQLLAQEGADVAILARGDGLEDVAVRVRAQGSRAVEVRADVGDREALERRWARRRASLAAWTWWWWPRPPRRSAPSTRYGPRTSSGACRSPSAAVDTIRAVLPHLERTGGTLVVVGSVVDVLPLIPMPSTPSAHIISFSSGIDG